jgi:Domain of unknown function (DUF4129)
MIKSKSTTLFLAALLVAVCAAAAKAESVSLAEYQRQTHAMAEKISVLKLHPDQAATLLAEIPDKVTVNTGSGEITVSHKHLRDDLAVFSGADDAKRAALFPRIRDYAQALDAAAEAYGQATAADLPSAHGRLDQILSRHEFKKVKEPTAKDALLAKLYRWLSRLLNKLSTGAGASFDWMRLVIYLLVGAAISMLAIWTVHHLRRPLEDLPRREVVPFSPSARSWRSWLADARSLAQRQDWRNAIHLAYWAGISYLEEHGAWKPNRARTPREYLRLMGARGAQYPALAALTRKLEVVWYGYGTALESDFQETLAQLEKLGCR